MSVVMATFDGAPFLQVQLASLDAQTRRPDELVLSDDGSRDDTLEIARSFAATASFPVRILEGPQRGLAENFWFATSAAQGQLIAWSDQDDVWAPTKLEVCERALARHSAELVTHSASLVDANLQPIGATHRRLPPWRVRPGRRPDHRRTRVLAPLEGDPWRVIQGFSMVFTRTLVERVDWAHRPPLHATGNPASHDGLLGVVAFATARRVELTDDLALYRRHGANHGGLPEPQSLAAARGVGYDAYRARAEHALSYLRILEGSGLASPEVADYFERLAARIRSRSQVYAAPSRRSGIACVARCLSSGTYGSVDHGRFRRLAILKDLEHVALRPSAS